METKKNGRLSIGVVFQFLSFYHLHNLHINRFLDLVKVFLRMSEIPKKLNEILDKPM